MNTIAIWYDCTKKKHDCNTVSANLHINFWKLKKTKWKVLSFQRSNKEYMLDLGMMIDGFKEIENLYIFIPLSIKKNDIIDLGNILSSEDKLLDAVFNENYHIDKAIREKHHPILQDEKPIFTLMNTKGSEFVTVEQKEPGSIISFSIKHLSSKITTQSIYIRFRVPIKMKDRFIYHHSNKCTALYSAFSRTEVIDFRINAIRLYTESLTDLIGKGFVLKLKKINFFALRPATDDLVTSSHKAMVRELEKGIWQPYLIDAKYETNNILAYHMKVEADEPDKAIDSEGFFLKFIYSKSNWRTIIIYLIFLFFFSVGANYFSSCLYDKRIDKSKIESESVIQNKKGAVK